MLTLPLVHVIRHVQVADQKILLLASLPVAAVHIKACEGLAANKARAAHLAEGLPLLNVQPGGKQFHAVPDDVTVEWKSLSWSHLLQEPGVSRCHHWSSRVQALASEVQKQKEAL